MTVGELREKLEGFPYGAQVVMFDVNDSGQEWYCTPLGNLIPRYMVRVKQDKRAELVGRYTDLNGRGYQPEETSKAMPVVLIT